MSAHLYRHFDSRGTLLYVGISLSALHRLAQHRDHSSWFHEIGRVEIKHFDTRELAIAAEVAAIRTENPKWNIRRYPAPQPYPTRLEARAALTARVVAFEPLYSIAKAGSALGGLGPQAVKRLIEQHKLGYVDMPRGSTTRRFVTGWQLIEYIESLEGKVHESLPD